MSDAASILQTAALAGQLLLESGAEIFRVHETMMRILSAFGARDANVFVLSNGLFASAFEGTDHAQSIVRDVPLGSVDLWRIAQVNNVSRRVCCGQLDVCGALEALERIKAAPRRHPVFLCAVCGAGTLSFCGLFGGGIWECLCAFFCGAALEALLLFGPAAARSRFGACALGGALTTFLTGLAALAFPALQMDPIIIGSIMPLVPGFAFTSGIREAFGGDYLCGVIHILDAVLTGVCIALGVTGAMYLLSGLGGGV